MTKDKWIIDKEKAKTLLAVDKKGMVHTFFNMPFGLLGGDHSFESVCKDIDKAYKVKITGDQAQAMNHGLVIIPNKECKQSDLLFLETKERTDKS